MSALVAAARKEGMLNVIALPPTWANYGAILSAFTARYGIKIHSALPGGSSQQEIDAVKSGPGTARAPDVLDLSMAAALANTSLFAPYEVSTWPDIPAAQKDVGGLWYQDYGGYMAAGYSGKLGTITSLNDLLGPRFKGAVALNGDPTQASAALNGVMMASLAAGRCSSRRTPSWAATTHRPSTSTRRIRPRPGCGRSSCTPKAPRAARTSGSVAAIG